MSTGSELKTAKPMTIRDRLNSQAMKLELARVLPKHCSADRMARVAITAMTKNPMLADCDQASFFRCLLDLSQWGLEPDGRRAHLIPFRNNKKGIIECQLIVDYKGLIELAYNSGFVESVEASVVREGDLFEYSLGQITKHTPWFLRQDAGKPEHSGKVFAAYCIIRLKAGASKTEVMAVHEIEAIRQRSRAGNSGPWVTDWDEMAKKTVFKRASKWIPLAAEMRDLLEKDEEIDHGGQDAANSMANLISSSSSRVELLAQNMETIEADPIEETIIEQEPEPKPAKAKKTPPPDVGPKLVEWAKAIHLAADAAKLNELEASLKAMSHISEDDFDSGMDLLTWKRNQIGV